MYTYNYNLRPTTPKNIYRNILHYLNTNRSVIIIFYFMYWLGPQDIFIFIIKMTVSHSLLRWNLCQHSCSKQ